MAATQLNPSDDDSVGFSIDIVAGAGETRLIIRGEIDLSVREELSRALDDVVAPGHRVVLDLSQVPFLDSTGIGAFARAAAEGCEVVVLMAQPAVRRALEVSGMDKVVRIQD